MRTEPNRAAPRLVQALVAAALLAGAAHAQPTGSSTAPTPAAPSEAAAEPPEGRFAFHAQTTFVYQGQDDLHAPYRGPNSFSSSANARETWDLTLYAGLRLWKGAEVWVNPEVDQGFGLADTLGAAGFPSGEAYKVGAAEPYFRVQRVLFRQTFDLPGASETVESDVNQFGGTRSANRVTLTLGKMSVGDIFDTNSYAHDPRADFLNWTVIDVGTFDYAADAWGYSAGAALEWRQGRWTLRGGAFLLSNVPNSTKIDTRFDQFQGLAELEERHTIAGHPGVAKITGFLSRGRMGKLRDATALALATGAPADVSLVRRYDGRPGVSVNLEQEVAEGVGVFARAGWTDGRYEAYEFTDVDRSYSGGVSVSGRRWGRPNDRAALAGVINEASKAREAYLDAGGLGILIGDGRLPHPDSERILEAYYDLAAPKLGPVAPHVTLDFQRIENPGYNSDRGPASILALRLHGQF